MFLQRAFISVTLGSLAVWLLYLGGWFYFVPVLLLLLIGGFEYNRMITAMEIRMARPLLFIAIGLQVTAAMLLGSEAVSAALIVSLFGALCVALWRYERGESAPRAIAAEWMATVTGIVFLGWMGSHFILLRNLIPASGSVAWQWTTLVIMATWGADSGAYAVGSFLTRWIGRHALTPRLSPKKSVEGYIGGIVVGTLFGWIFGSIVHELPLRQVIPLALFVTALGTAGDLCVSMLKREAQVKDSGAIFLSHGGALDRLDSIIWTTTLAYYWILFFW